MTILRSTSSFEPVATAKQREGSTFATNVNDSNSGPIDITNNLIRYQNIRRRPRYELGYSCGHNRVVGSHRRVPIKKNDPHAPPKVLLRHCLREQQQQRLRKYCQQQQHDCRENQENLPHQYQRQYRKEEQLFYTNNRTIDADKKSTAKVVVDEETDNRLMPPPKEEMTNLMLLNRQNRFDGRSFPVLDGLTAIIEEIEDEDEVVDPTDMDQRPIAHTNLSSNGTTALVRADTHEGIRIWTGATNGMTSPYNPDGYHFTNLPDGTPVYSSISPFCSRSIGDGVNNKGGASRKICIAAKDGNNNVLSSTESLSTSHTSLHTIDNEQDGMLYVGKSSIGPLAQSSCIITAKEISDSKATINNNIGGQCNNSGTDEELHQSVGKISVDSSNDVMEGSGFDASSSIDSALSSSISSISVTTGTDPENSNDDDYEVHTSQLEKKRRKEQCSHFNQKRRYNDDEFDVERSVSEEDVRKSKPTNANVTQFKDIIGHQSVKLRLDEILLPLALPASISRTILKGVRSLPASILMYGPPGCGKTQLAKAVAGEAHAAFLSIGPSDILSKYVGESEAAIRSVFAEAVRMARNNSGGNRCTVLFFDEIDALGQSRGIGSNRTTGGGGKDEPSTGTPEQSGGSGAGDNSSRRILAELLIQLSKVNTFHGTYESLSPTDKEDILNEKEKESEETRFDYIEEFPTSDDTVIEMISEEGRVKRNRNEIESDLPTDDNQTVRVIVVAATNRPGDCDPALIRRFAVQVQVGLPTAKDRRKMLKQGMEDIEHTVTKKQLSDLSLITDGWSGSDLQSLSREAAMAPVRECIRRAAQLKRRRFVSETYRGKKKIDTDIMEQSHCGEEKIGEDETEGSNIYQSRRKTNESDVDCFSEPQKRLLEEFRNLRPVNFRDYTKALAFWFSRMYSNLYDSPLAEFGWIEDCGGNLDYNGTLNEHYDSSSDEDDIEEVHSNKKDCLINRE